MDEIKKVCSLELDCYWVFFAGRNAPEYLRENGDAVGLIHIKDGGTASPSPCALGEGKNDIAGICAAAEEIGEQWVIVENDNPTPNGFEDAERSLKWLLESGI